MKIIIWALLLISTVTLNADPDSRRGSNGEITGPEKEANLYNINGMAAYKKKSYPEAVKWFQKAISADPRHRLANYNLACTYALLKGACGTLEELDNAPANSIIYEQLERAIRIDPSVKIKAQTDGDFEKVKNDIPFLSLLGIAPNKQENAGWREILLKRPRWYTGSCSGGTAGCSYLKFGADGGFTYYDINNACSIIDLLEDGEEKCTSQRKGRLMGTFEVRDGNVILKFDSGERETYSFPLQGGENELRENHPDPCSA